MYLIGNDIPTKIHNGEYGLALIFMLEEMKDLKEQIALLEKTIKQLSENYDI